MSGNSFPTHTWTTTGMRELIKAPGTDYEILHELTETSAGDFNVTPSVVAILCEFWILSGLKKSDETVYGSISRHTHYPAIYS